MVHGVEVSEIFAPFVHLLAEVEKHFDHQKARLLFPTILIRLIYPLVLFFFPFPPSMK
jgi:hypothetical protein